MRTINTQTQTHAHFDSSLNCIYIELCEIRVVKIKDGRQHYNENGKKKEAETAHVFNMFFSHIFIRYN